MNHRATRRPRRHAMHFLIACTVCSLILTLQGCAALDATGDASGLPGAAGGAPVQVKPPAVPAPTDKRDSTGNATAGTPAQIALAKGLEAYNRGEYNLAIKRFAASDISTGDQALQVSALKYTAFSYCVSKRQTKCRERFAAAFKLDPHFELAPGEKGHPLWGPAFELAKKSVRVKVGK